jgi:N-acetylglucosamine malate deacetylase 1
MTILAVGAHPDDVEICCFGTLARCVERGDKVVVCSVTNGNLGHATIDQDQLRMIRMMEGARAAETIGATYCTLDIDDMHVDCTNLETRLKLTDLIRAVGPHLIITHDPEDYHPDHTSTSRLVFYCSMQATLPQVTTKNPAIKQHCNIYYMDKVGGGIFIPTEYVDISETFEQKKNALACHISQVQWLKQHDGVDLLHAIEVLSEYRGMQCGARYAEAYKKCDQRPLTAVRELP